MHRSIYRTLRYLSPALACLATICSVGPLWAATKAEKLRASEDLVREALHREIYGLDNERHDLLDRAAEETPDFAPAMWHRGYVRWQNKWVKAEEIPQLVEKDPRIVLYRKIRGDYPQTVQGQLALAEWCHKKGLDACERAHLGAVLGIDPDNVEARTRLGFHQVDGDWVSDAELAEAAHQIDATGESLAKWRDQMEKIVTLLAAKSEAKREVARERVLKIIDPSAVPALEHFLATESKTCAELAVEALDHIDTRESAMALGRLAVFSPWAETRRAAAEKLKSRPEDNYIPAMLASMYTPMVAQTAVVPGLGGRLLYRHAFMREGQNERELLVLDTTYQRIARMGGNGAQTLSRMLGSAGDTAVMRHVSVSQMNRRTEELNGRVAAALNIATEQKLPAKPQAWWDWWNDRNEIFVQGQKHVQAVRRGRQIGVVDFVPAGAAGGIAAASASAVSQDLKDCLAPGTRIWTVAGPVAVEKLQIGDLVLSQNVDTGELTYEPVVRTTIRPKSRVVRIHAGEMTIEASGGHPFWVSGEGWVKARDLASGMELHCVSGTLRISAVEKGEEMETFNLIVGGFNTYFVGDARVLSHDNTIREGTDAIVPGLEVK